MKYGSRIIGKKQYILMKQFQNMRKFTSRQSEESEYSDLGHCLSSALIFDLSDIPKDIVRLYSTVTVSNDKGWSKEFQLVLPNEVGMQKGVISVDSVLGAAVIGLSEGDCTEYGLNDGNFGIKIERVLQDQGASKTSLEKHFF
jgi:regulator of nucleoside diphosphate kinase